VQLTRQAVWKTAPSRPIDECDAPRELLVQEKDMINPVEGK